MTKMTESTYLKQYSIHDYDIPLVSTDLAIFTLINYELHILLVERAEHPHKGKWSLPGGFINQQTDKDLAATAARKLKEKTGIKSPYLEQVNTIGDGKRDPRGWSVTVLYMALIAHTPTADFIDAVKDARWWPLDAALKQPLAFDHRHLIQQARDRLRTKTGYTVLPVHILNAPFTLTQLQQAFEVLLEQSLEKKSFRRRILGANLLEEVGEGLPEGGRGRIATLYRPVKGCEDHAFVRVFGNRED